VETTDRYAHVDQKIHFLFQNICNYFSIESANQLPRAHMEKVIMNKNGDLNRWHCDHPVIPFQLGKMISEDRENIRKSSKSLEHSIWSALSKRSFKLCLVVLQILITSDVGGYGMTEESDSGTEALPK